MFCNTAENCKKIVRRSVNIDHIPLVSLYSKTYCWIGLFPSYGRFQVRLTVRDETDTTLKAGGASGGS